MEPIYQCCYTNATQSAGDKVTSGWQTTAVSPDIPRDAHETCVKLQNANAPLCANAVDERGNVLALWEILGDGSYLYVIQTQFGLTDRLGRPNMFSHAVIFPLRNNRDIFWNPNFFLALHPSCFLRGGDRLTWENTPAYATSLSLEAAMRWAKLDRERYAALVRCVYAQSSGPKGTEPLYIEYDGTARQLRGLLTCIYEGIPWYMRRSLRIASCPTANDGGKNLVFSQNARTKASYLIPQTGENNILPPRIERRIQRYGFIDYAVRELPLEEFPSHFERLEKTAACLGDVSASNSQVLKLAFYFWTRPDMSMYTDEELESNLSDALRLPPADNQLLENFLTRMLREVKRRGLRLTDESKALLDAWMAATKSEDLKAAGR